MGLSTGNWLTIIAILIAIIIGIFQYSRSSKMKIKQKSGAFSKGDQTIKINNGTNDEKK